MTPPNPEPDPVFLPANPPFDGLGVLRWLAARAVNRLEEVTDSAYRRAVRVGSSTRVLSITVTSNGVYVSLQGIRVRDNAMLLRRVSGLFDLDADPAVYTKVLMSDDVLARSVRANPGLRVPGTLDGAESAIRTVLGQQISLAAARKLTERLVAAIGERLDDQVEGVTHAFPSVETLARVDLAEVGMPMARRETVRALASAIARGEIVLTRSADAAQTCRRLLEIRGIGEWTASYIALRALGDRDAFPVADSGIRRGARLLGMNDEPSALVARAESWRPWRAYAAHLLWTVQP